MLYKGDCVLVISPMFIQLLSFMVSMILNVLRGKKQKKQNYVRFLSCTLIFHFLSTSFLRKNFVSGSPTCQPRDTLLLPAGTSAKL